MRLTSSCAWEMRLRFDCVTLATIEADLGKHPKAFDELQTLMIPGL